MVAEQSALHTSTSPGDKVIQVTVVDAQGPHQVRELVLSLPERSTVQVALSAAQKQIDLPGLQVTDEVGALLMSVWGRQASLQQVLRDLDRVELTRPLRVDPKVARRERFAKQGAGRTGLFAKRRPGAKAGY